MKNNKKTKEELIKKYFEQAGMDDNRIFQMHANVHDNSGDFGPYHNNSHDNTPGFNSSIQKKLVIKR